MWGLKYILKCKMQIIFLLGLSEKRMFHVAIVLQVAILKWTETFQTHDYLTLLVCKGVTQILHPLTF